VRRTLGCKISRRGERYAFGLAAHDEKCPYTNSVIGGLRAYSALGGYFAKASSPASNMLKIQAIRNYSVYTNTPGTGTNSTYLYWVDIKSTD
jgi:hypothetical protein